jgi:hypothetical protein
VSERNVAPIHPFAVRRAALVGKFTDRDNKPQVQVFERLARFVEDLHQQVKCKPGARLGQAYGKQTKHRFHLKDGKPGQLNKTPDSWITVLKGFAEVLGQNADRLIVEALEDAYHNEDKRGSATFDSLEKFNELLAALCTRLNAETDFVGLSDYVARSGLYLQDDGTVCVSEWPLYTVGLQDGGDYNEQALQFVPKVYGINGTKVCEEEWHCDDAGFIEPDDFGSDRQIPLPDWVPPKLADELGSGSTVTLVELRLIGICFATNAETLEADIALIEWDCAFAKHKPASGDVVDYLICDDISAGVERDSPIAGSTILFEAYRYRYPLDWHPNSIVIHFRGSNGFRRLTQSTLEAPWCLIAADYHEGSIPLSWNSDQAHFYEDYPVASPKHTVAAFIEGNLLYADGAGEAKRRIDRLLLEQLRHIETQLTQFRDNGEVVRKARHDSLLAEWRKDTSE